MNTSTNFFDFIQKGFRVTVGAAATLLETLQNPQKREVTMSDFRSELQTRAEQWSEKGEMTEQEARKLLEKIFQQDRFAKDAGSQQVDTSATEVKDSDLQNELKTLTEQIVTLKIELEELRQNQSSNQ